MPPHANGSSTTGVMQSSVATSARSSVIWYTAASSASVAPTSTCSSAVVGMWRSTCANSVLLSLQAQPAPWLRLVSLGYVAFADCTTSPLSFKDTNVIYGLVVGP